MKKKEIAGHSFIDWAGKCAYPPCNGAYVNVDEALYHQDKTRLSKSQMVMLLRSPAHWRADYDGKRPRKQTDAMRWGSMLDLLLTEPERWERTVAVGPNCSRANKPWKEFIAALPAGIIPMKQEEYNQIAGAQLALFEHPIARRYFHPDNYRKNVFQLTINWTLENHGETIEMRSRLDCVHFQENGEIIIVDLKKARDARGDAFSRQVAELRYDMQAVIYEMALTQALPRIDSGEISDFQFVAVEDTPPHAIGIFRCGNHFRAIGEQSVRKAAGLFLLSANNDVFPGYGLGIETIEPPRYFASRFAHLEDKMEDDDEQ